MPNFFLTSFITFLSLLLGSCGSHEGINGFWQAGDKSLKINLEVGTIEYTNKTVPENSFKGEIDSIKNTLDGKIEINLTNKEKKLFKTFNEDTIFYYTENGYVRLKK